MNEPGYERYEAARSALTGRLTRLANLAASVGADARARHLASSRAALEADRFRILVLGEFKRGKSTLLNAMLGEPVLPAKVAPCTGLFIELSYGPAPRAVLRREGRTAEIPVGALREHVVIREEEDGPPPVSWTHLELSWPLPLLRHHVELVDSPGLNEHVLRDAQVLDYLPRADAVLFVLSCEQQLSASELAFLDAHLGRQGVRNAFFVWNRYDVVRDDPAEVEALRELTARELEPRLAPGLGPRVFSVSARDALRARQAREEAALEASGLPALERALEAFLASERAEVKLSTPRRAAARAVRELLAEHLPARERLFEEPVEAQRRRFLELRPRLDALEAERQAALRLVERRRGLLARELATAWTDEVAALARDLPGLAEQVELGTWELLRSSRDARKKVAEHLDRAVALRVRRWEAEVVAPLCTRHQAALEADLQGHLRSFVRALGEARLAVDPRAVEAGGEDLDPLSRVLGAVGGLFLGGLGAAMEGARGGVGGMLRGLGYHVALGVGLVLLGATAPMVLAASAALGAVRLLAGAQGEARALRAQVAGACVQALKEDVPAVAAAFEARLAERFSALEQSLDQGMAVMIEDVSGQLAGVVAARERGEVALGAERERLANVRRELLAIDEES